jgi:hypothetical protein
MANIATKLKEAIIPGADEMHSVYRKGGGSPSTSATYRLLRGKLHGLFGVWCLDPAIHNCPHCKIDFDVEDKRQNGSKNNGSFPPFPWAGC